VNFLLGIARGIDAGTRALGRVAWWASLAMVLAGFEYVLARYGYEVIAALFGVSTARALSSNVMFEAQTQLFNVVFLLGAAYVLQVDGHVRVDILFSRFTARTRAWIDVIGTAVFLWPFAALTIMFSQRYVGNSWAAREMSPNAGGLPLYPLKTLIVVAFALLIAQGFAQIIKHAAFLRGHPNSGSHYADAPSGHGQTPAAGEGVG
jgi:TRAP-type mannitol/chloroaromatic compound transport system permease small subunit